MVLKVAVIGAGACGLAALRRLNERPDLFAPVAFEQSSRVGGTWVYTGLPNNIDKQKGYNVHSSMYKNLRTNLAKEGMYFPGYQFPSHLPSYIMHWEMLQYLEDFTQHFDLKKLIQFSRRVVLVRPLPRWPASAGYQWHVEVHNEADPSAPNEVHIFDAILICNGHYSVPRVPEVPGLSTFEGSLIHCHYYREPEAYRGMKVACLGAGVSGPDVAVDISQHAAKVIWSGSDGPFNAPLPSNVLKTPPVTEVRGRSVVYRDAAGVEREEQVDAIVLCTGYLYSFPFLHPSCGITVDDDKGRVQPLYKHVVNTAFPTMFFVGLCTRLCAWPIFDSQVRFAVATLTGGVKLPSRKEMEKDAEEDYARRIELGICRTTFHSLAITAWDYNSDLANQAHFEDFPLARRELCLKSQTHWLTDYLGFRNFNYEIVDEDKADGFRSIDNNKR